MSFQILHHGAVDGVTGSCHELRLASGAGLLVDCGLFQGEEESAQGAGAQRLAIEFPVRHLRALVVTHVHIDHVGRIPYLLAAGFEGPIYCSQPSAELLPLVLEDSLRVGVTRDRQLLDKFLTCLQRQIKPLAYGAWQNIDTGTAETLEIRLQPAGHILGSAYVMVRLGGQRPAPDTLVVFSGDLGPPHTPLLAAPRSPWRADVVVLESTYGDRRHEGRRLRRRQLQQVLETALADGGAVLVPAFSIGRTQELLYELEGIIHAHRKPLDNSKLPWQNLEIIVDSPLANRFSAVYRNMSRFWDAEAHRRLQGGRKPLSFPQLTTIDDHAEHQRKVAHLTAHGGPCVVIAAGGMCQGGRIVNYLKALLGDPRTDVLLVGYQARGTPGRDIQVYGPRGGYVLLDGERYTIRAKVHTLAGYSAHGDQFNLVNFVGRMRHWPQRVRLVHGEFAARQALKAALEEILGEGRVEC